MVGYAKRYGLRLTSMEIASSQAYTLDLPFLPSSVVG